MAARRLRKNGAALTPEQEEMICSSDLGVDVARKLGITPQAVSYHRVRLLGREKPGAYRPAKDRLKGRLQELYAALERPTRRRSGLLTRLARQFGVSVTAIRYHDRKRALAAQAVREGHSGSSVSSTPGGEGARG